MQNGDLQVRERDGGTGRWWFGSRGDGMDWRLIKRRCAQRDHVTSQLVFFHKSPRPLVCHPFIATHSPPKLCLIEPLAVLLLTVIAELENRGPFPIKFLCTPNFGTYSKPKLSKPPNKIWILTNTMITTKNFRRWRNITVTEEDFGPQGEFSPNECS